MSKDPYEWLIQPYPPHFLKDDYNLTNLIKTKPSMFMVHKTMAISPDVGLNFKTLV